MTSTKVIIGVNAYHADSSACIIINGKLIAAIEEERINRKKHYSGFPLNSIKECLKIAKIKEIDITDVAFNTRPLSNLLAKGIYYIKNLAFRKNYTNERFLKKKGLNKIFKEHFKLNKNIKFHFIEHHLSHLASAFYPSNFNKASGISIDGSGDFVTMAYAECSNNKIIIKKKNYFPNSLGIFYHAMTQFLGYNNYGDEYKIMGMAAYGKPLYFDKIKDNLFKERSKNFFDLNLKYFNHHKNNFKYLADENLLIDQIFNIELDDLFFDDKKNENFTKDFACSVQKVYEFYFSKIIKYIFKKNFSENLIFSGGCALNSSANNFITNNKKFFKEVYINCAPGDNGGALGAAFIVASKYNLTPNNLKSPYLGNNYDNDYINNVLVRSPYKDKLKYEFIKSDSEFLKSAALFISEGNVVGWFQNKMEFGPRALGSRSILADPRNPNMKDIINSKIKRRESFRPFAPSVLQKYQNIWFESNFESPYMSSLSLVKKEKREIIPAVTHFDNTARLQTVSKNYNSKFFDLITHFYNLTGVPILLNTSFNENEPIVMKPEEALECILRTDMDAIFMNNFIIKKI